MKYIYPSIACFCGFVLGAYSQDETKLEGEAFLVTKGAENIRLGAMEILLYPADTMRDHIMTRNERIKAEMPDFDKTINRQNNSIAETQKNLAKLKSLGGVDLRPFEDGLKSLVRWRDEELLAKATWPTAQHYFRSLPDTKLSTRTDADGKFTYAIPKGQVYVLAAHVARETYSSKERFYWLIRVSADSPTKKVLLSNHNLVISDSKESILHTKSAWTKWSEP